MNTFAEQLENIWRMNKREGQHEASKKVVHSYNQYDKKAKTLSLGSYPLVTLKTARCERDKTWNTLYLDSFDRYRQLNFWTKP